MIGKMSLVEQKRLQWARERDEMAKLNKYWEISKKCSAVHSTIRTKISSREQSISQKTLRACGQNGRTPSAKYLKTNAITSVQSLNLTLANSSMINIGDHQESSELMPKCSPSLPPIYTKETQHYHHQTQLPQELPSLGVEGSSYTNHPRVQKNSHYETERGILTCNVHEEREGETSGYASDSVETHVAPNDIKKLHTLEKTRGPEMSERTWRNPYCNTPNASLPPSKIFSTNRIGELNRPRWGSIWGLEYTNNDPPPPSWLERGLSRLDHTSQVLVINHDSLSSPDSTTTNSTNSDSKTYLRGQNIPVDAQILHERETRRQKALELQNAIRQQLVEKDKKRKEEREQKIKEEHDEEERIKRERNMEKERFEDEKQRLKEKEQAKLKKDETMREILETAERIAREKKRQHRQCHDFIDVNITKNMSENNMVVDNDNCCVEINVSNSHRIQSAQFKTDNQIIDSEPNYQQNINNENEIDLSKHNEENNTNQLNETFNMKDNSRKLPINKEVAIVLTGKIESTNFLDGNNLRLLNLVINPTQKCENNSNAHNTDDINAVLKNLGDLGLDKSTDESSSSITIIKNRLLTPSKYRAPSGRDFGTQTDDKNDVQDIESEEIMREHKEISINNSRDLRRSTNALTEDKNVSISKSQSRPPLESRPRWNANRPGIRYRTQSEKDPHYQKRLRLRRRRTESSEERSRSPSLDRRMSNAAKIKNRNTFHRKSKSNYYDAEMSMDSLNSVIPLQINEREHINLPITASSKINRQTNNTSNNSNDEILRIESNESVNIWSGRNIISQLVSLKNGLLSKQREWDSSQCLVSPQTEFY